MSARQYALHVGGKSYAVAKIVEVDVERKLLFVSEMVDGRLRVEYSKALGLTVDDLESISIERTDKKPCLECGHPDGHFSSCADAP